MKLLLRQPPVLRYAGVCQTRKELDYRDGFGQHAALTISQASGGVSLPKSRRAHDLAHEVTSLRVGQNTKTLP